MEPTTVKRVLEAALLAAREPMTPSDLTEEDVRRELSTETLRKLLDELRQEWQERPVELVQLASGWRFRTPAEYLPWTGASIPRKARAIPAPSWKPSPSSPTPAGHYAATSEIRGVAVQCQRRQDPGERGWIDVVGHRTPRPARPFATTKQFLDDLGLRSISELPPSNRSARPWN